MELKEKVILEVSCLSMTIVLGLCLIGKLYEFIGGDFWFPIILFGVGGGVGLLYVIGHLIYRDYIMDHRYIPTTLTDKELEELERKYK